MANEIKAEFTGNLGSIAEIKTSAGGKQYLTFNVGVTPAKKVGNEYVNGETMWLRVTSFDINTDLTDHLLKGAKVKVTGRLTQRTADTGKTYNDVIADTIEIVKREQSAVPNTWKAQAAKPYTDDEMPF
jgi:single-stranded DNA-binding protein